MPATTNARENFIQGISRIGQFWGFPRAMGALYAAIYLSPTPLCLDDLVEQVGVTKGAVSTSVRQLERLGMIHKQHLMGDRKDYYQAETDFWKIVKGILRARQKSEFDQALRSVTESLELLDSGEIDPQEAEIANFYRTRMKSMQQFFHSLDQIVATLIALDEFRISAIGKIFGVKETD